MSQWPAPARADHDRFCQIEGWRRVRDARGKSGTHHTTYELELADGRVLRTRVSHPPDRSHYGSGLWSHILRDQLDVTEEEFWTCLRDDVVPDRGQPAPSAAALPVELVNLLIRRVGLRESEVAAMTKPEAVERLNLYWAQG